MQIPSYLYLGVNFTIIIIQANREDKIPYRVHILWGYWHHCSHVDLDNNIRMDLAPFQLPNALAFTVLFSYCALMFIRYSNTRQIHSLDVVGSTSSIPNITNDLVICLIFILMGHLTEKCNSCDYKFWII